MKAPVNAAFGAGPKRLKARNELEAAEYLRPWRPRAGCGRLVAEIDAKLLTKATRRAQRDGTTLGAVIEAALLRALSAQARPAGIPANASRGPEGPV